MQERKGSGSENSGQSFRAYFETREISMKILFVYQSLISFVKKDLEILKSAHTVKEICFQGINNIPSLWNGIQWCDISFSWFGKLHAFFAVLFSKILHKKSVVIAGGDDVVYAPEINYGMFSFWWKRWCPLFVFRYADAVLTVSDYNTKESIGNARVSRNKIKRIYHGFDQNEFKKNENVKKEKIVITVGSISWEYLKRKGVELFVRSALELKEVPFYLIGNWEDNSVKYLKDIASSNMYLLGRVSDEKLKIYLSKAKVYVQVSRHEGFGCSLAEAMLCECIPVVSRCGAIPEVAGDAGIYVDNLTPDGVAEKIKHALALPDDYGKKARDTIIEKFSLNKREHQILRTIEKFNNERKNHGK
jgi:glycosyltransferase involved in cell wall biosynthesis